MDQPLRLQLSAISQVTKRTIARVSPKKRFVGPWKISTPAMNMELTQEPLTWKFLFLVSALSLKN